jgi:hypothetical protein
MLELLLFARRSASHAREPAVQTLKQFVLRTLTLLGFAIAVSDRPISAIVAA